MAIRIILRKDGVYDVYNKASGKWLFSTPAADNVFAQLSKMPCVQIDFVDETIPSVLREVYSHASNNDTEKKNEHGGDETFELKPCPICGGKAELCGEGMAKSVFEDGNERVFFTELDGYTVSCEDCVKTTKLCQTPDAAVEEWNKFEKKQNFGNERTHQG